MTERKENRGIMDYMRTVMDTYEKLRGKEIDHSVTPFWDVVVITTADEEQKQVFDTQLEEKIMRNELPLGIPIHVCADPPGPKLGNGGSTLTCLKMLDDVYQKDLYSKRVLLIHAGGQSKRMPSTSVLGKIFSPIPTGSPIYQMLDLKLAMYLPFLEKMPAGVFVACADDFMVYNLGKDCADEWSFSATGFTALAHPSTIAVGVKHGVYVLKDVNFINTSCNVQQHQCLEVLQKPSEEVMYRKNAVLKGMNLKFPDGVTVKGSVAYTDSAFFFGSDTTKKFVYFVRNNGPVTCEIDAYGDFLQALGPNATIDYTKNIANVTKPTPSLLSTREKIFHLLEGSDIRILLLNSSRFIHIGTTKEYINHFCFDTKFQEEMNLQKDVFNHWTVQKDEGDLCEIPKKRKKISDISCGCVMHSSMPEESFIPEASVVEYCQFDIPVTVGNNTILSNCKYILDENKSFTSKDSNSNTHVRPQNLKIPHNTFLHTVPVNFENTVKFVTIIFHINDDLKKMTTPSKVSSLPFLGRSVESFCSSCDIDIVRVLPRSVDDTCDNKVKVSLWDLSLFPVAETMSESLLKSLSLFTAVTKDEAISNFKETSLLSMDSILQLKNVKKMLELRNELFQEIQQSV